MSTIAFALGCLILALIILDRIPGVRHLISPIVSGFSGLITVTVGSFTGWTAWIIKTLWNDHVTLLRNLTSTRQAIDPTDPYR